MSPALTRRGPPARAAHIPLFLYPFLNTVSKTRPFEYLRLTSLGVIGALVKVRRSPGARRPRHDTRTPPRGATRGPPSRHAPHWRDTATQRSRRAVLRCAQTQVDDTGVINFLLSTEIIPLCLRTMEMGSELSKTVATFIVQKILLDDVRTRAPRSRRRRPGLTAARPRAGGAQLYLRHRGALLRRRRCAGQHGSDVGTARGARRFLATQRLSALRARLRPAARAAVGSAAEAHHPVLFAAFGECSRARLPAPVLSGAAARPCLCGVPQGGRGHAAGAHAAAAAAGGGHRAAAVAAQ